MKTKIYLVTLVFLFLVINIKAQTYSNILKTIEENNKEIQAGKKYLESKSLEYRQDNLPEGPELSYGYFPNNSSVPGTKEVFEVTQSFQMPCYYRNKSAHSKLMISQEEYNQLILRQDILSQAKGLLINYVYLAKKAAIAGKRLEFASDMYNAFLIRLEVGDANTLEINKAKLHLIQVQNQEKQIRTELFALKEKLNKLNGGNELTLNINEYPLDNLVNLDSVLFEKMESDPELLLSKKEIELSEKQLQVTKNLQLPKFNVGYGTETVADEKFKGVLVGVSIPLWSSKRSIQQAKLEREFYSINNESVSETKISETKILYDQAVSLKDNLESYQTVLSSLNSEELLKKSLEAGEISIIDFFTEMFYYYEIYDDFLLTEKEYHQAINELYTYKL